MYGLVAKETMEERKEARNAPRASNLIGTVRKTKDPMETKMNVRAELDIATISEGKSTSE